MLSSRNATDRSLPFPSACIVTALRIVIVYQSKETGYGPHTTAYDALWATLEPNLGIICACVPVMHPVQSKLKAYLHGLTGGFRGTSHRSLRSSSEKIGDDKPLTRHADVNRLYPLSVLDGTVSGAEQGGSLEQLDVERGHY